MNCRVALLVSLVFNVLLAGLCAWSLRGPAPARSGMLMSAAATNGTVNPRASEVPSSELPPSISPAVAFDWSQAVSINLTQYAANLKSIECPKEIVREIILAVVNEDFVRRRHAIFEPIHAGFWDLMTQPDQFKPSNVKDADRLSNELRAERDEQLEALLGPDWSSSADPPLHPLGYFQPAMKFLSEEKQRRWAEMDQTFNQRQQEILRATREDPVEQQALLQLSTKQRDETRRQLLTDSEFQEYQARTSERAAWAQNLPGVEATEAEYRELNQLRLTTPTNRPSLFDSQARALLGDDRFAALQRGQDPRFAEIAAMAQRCQLSKPVTEILYQQRVNAEAQAALVGSNATLSAGEQRMLLEEIHSETRRQLFNMLGPTAGEAYLRHHGNWLIAINTAKLP